MKNTWSLCTSPNPDLTLTGRVTSFRLVQRKMGVGDRTWQKYIIYQFRQVQAFTLTCVHTTASEEDFPSHDAPVFCVPPRRRAHRLPRHEPPVCSVSVLGELHTARLRQKAKKGRAMIGPQSVKGGLKNDVMSVAVRPRPVRNRWERLLEKVCGRGKKVDGVNKPWGPEIKTTARSIRIQVRR